MILAAGLTPAWQQVMLLEKLRPGEVNRAREVLWCASGKVLNVGLALHHLSGPSLTIAMLGGHPAAAIDAEFAELGVPRHWVRSMAPTRTCTTLLDRATGQTTELVENARPTPPEDLARFIADYGRLVAEAKMVVLTGSLPTGVPATIFRDLLRQTSCPAVIDSRGAELLSALEEKPLVVKPNREELAFTVGRALDSDDEVRLAMFELNDRGAEWVVVSNGKEPLWASNRGQLFQYDAPHVAEVVNPIACGDCLAAGMAWAIHAGWDMPRAIRYGLEAAAENARHLLPGRVSAVVGKQHDTR